MSSTATSTYRRRLGRAPSPPTWLWYEQIPYDDDSSCSDEDRSDYDDYDDHDDRSCSEDDEDYAHNHSHAHGSGANPVAPASESGSNTDSGESRADAGIVSARNGQEGGLNEKMDMDAQDRHKGAGGDVVTKDLKGKQRAVDPEMDETPRRRERERRRKREPVITLRPILTIQKSQGFVWNQDLFVPPYIKDRYVASTSPPNGNGCCTAPASSYNPMNDYEVDVVEIRVKEGEYADIIP